MFIPSSSFTVKINDNTVFGNEGEEDEILFDDIYEDGGEEEADIDAVCFCQGAVNHHVTVMKFYYLAIFPSR